MGGIGDYSGSLVLEMPISESAFAAAQLVREPGIFIASVDGDRGDSRFVAISAEFWSQLVSTGYAAAREALALNGSETWAAYVAGPVLTLLLETGAKLTSGLRILIDSQVPEGKGVSSSAAIEVATMRAVAALLQIELPDETLARLCQLAENLVVGAPCGIMDQMTSALGHEHELLALRCQPATIEGFVPIPQGIAFWGIDSGIGHAVTGSDYCSVRCGAFMGYRMIADIAGLAARPADDDSGRIVVDDKLWHGYLANIAPSEFQERFAAVIPERISGREFLARFGGTTDHVTRVDPTQTYSVLGPTLHPIEENRRVERFREVLQSPVNMESLAELGELMYAAHASYSECSLGSDGTDLLVDLVRQVGPNGGLYGAKITGGGSGGTVAVLGRVDAVRAIECIAHQYEERTGRATHIFRDSSPGAYGTPVRQVII